VELHYLTEYLPTKSRVYFLTGPKITKRLIEEKGFTAVAAEADWPDAYRINRYVRNASDDVDAEEALGDFRRFPRWMWRNRSGGVCRVAASPQRHASTG
jgi:hypothetical protein